MARPVSATFKAAWANKTSAEIRTRVLLKKRYFNGSAFVLEADWTIIEERVGKSGGLIATGPLPHTLDSTDPNVFQITTVTLAFANERGQWIESQALPSLFAADAVSNIGYRLHKSLVQVQTGIRLPDGSIEWTERFTGYVSKARMTGRGAIAEVEVVNAANLQSADASLDSITVTLEDCIPPVGDGTRVEFESTSTGVDRITDLQVTAGSLVQGSEWTVSNLNKVADAESNGRAKFKLAVAPAVGAPVKTSLVKWKQGETIEDLMDALCVLAGQTDRQIDAVILPGNLSGSVIIDSEVEWASGTTLTGIDTSTFPGDIINARVLYDDFESGTFALWTTSGTMSVDSKYGSLRATNRNTSSGFTLSGYIEASQTYAYGTWEFTIAQRLNNVPLDYFEVDFIRNASTRYTVGIFGGNMTSLAFVKNGTPLANVTLQGGRDTVRTIRIERDTDGTFRFYEDDVLVLTRVDNDILTSTTFRAYIVGTNSALEGAAWLDNVKLPVLGIYEKTFDLLSAPIAWGKLLHVGVFETGGPGDVVYKTAGSTVGIAGPFDAFSTIAVDGTVQSALKRYLKLRVEIPPAANRRISRIDILFQTNQVRVALANYGGLSVYDALEGLVDLFDGEMIFNGAGGLIIRGRDNPVTPVINLTQENAIIDVLDYDTGEGRVATVGRITYNGYTSEWDGADAGETPPTSEQEFGRIIISKDLSRFLLANNVDIGLARARLAFERNYRRKRRWRLRVWDVPWVEIADAVQFSYYDNPRQRQTIAGDPIIIGDDGYMAAGEAQNVLARDVVGKLLEYKPDPGERTAEALVEEILS